MWACQGGILTFCTPNNSLPLGRVLDGAEAGTLTSLFILRDDPAQMKNGELGLFEKLLHPHLLCPSPSAWFFPSVATHPPISANGGEQPPTLESSVRFRCF